MTVTPIMLVWSGDNDSTVVPAAVFLPHYLINPAPVENSFRWGERDQNEYKDEYCQVQIRIAGPNPKSTLLPVSWDLTSDIIDKSDHQLKNALSIVAFIYIGKSDKKICYLDTLEHWAEQGLLPYHGYNKVEAGSINFRLTTAAQRAFFAFREGIGGRPTFDPRGARLKLVHSGPKPKS
jgi:hypothetical protein